jgi:predicted homoserine dehydrogenase-like protein
MTYSLSTDIGKVRLLISDTDETDEIFEDEEIQSFLDMEGSVKLAAAQALDTIADNEALASKVLTSSDVSVDGAKLADSLRKRAIELRSQSDSPTSGFEIVDFEYEPGLIVW